ncbi:MAG: type II toxin-antitoxin system PemK/MazF family toxin [bacterium]
MKAYYLKRFLEWIFVKQKLHDNIAKTPFVSEGDLWWASLGENIGKEINGKSELFTRPVLILKKFSPETFLVLPLTTKDKKGSWYVEISKKGRRQIAILSQIRTIDSKRLATKLGAISDHDIKKTKGAFVKLLLS